MTDKIKKRQRIPFYDTVKGLCIIQVVLFHSQVPYVGTGYIVSITLSAFVFISGYFFKPEIKTIFRAIDTLIVPYMTTFLFYNIFNIAIGGERIIPRSIWFLYVLFLSTIIYWLLVHFIKAKKILSLLCFCCALFSFFLGEKHNLGNLQVGSILYSVFILHLGHIFSTYKIHEWKWIVYIVPLMLSIVFYNFFYIDQWHVIHSIRYNGYYENFIITYAILLCGIFTLFMFAKLLNKLMLFTFFGRYSLIILCYHIFIVKNFTSPIGAVIIVLTSPIVIVLIERYIPFLFGLSPSIGSILKKRWENHIEKKKLGKSS